MPTLNEVPEVDVAWSGIVRGWPERVTWMVESDVASALANNLIANTLERAHRFPTRDDGKPRAHRVMTTLPISTPEGSGISSPRAFKSSTTSSIASRMLAKASSTESPWL